MMNCEQAIFLTSRRLARAITGHTVTCGCEECCIIGQLLGADSGLRKAHLYAFKDLPSRTRGTEARGVIESLTGEDPNNSTDPEFSSFTARRGPNAAASHSFSPCPRPAGT